MFSTYLIRTFVTTGGLRLPLVLLAVATALFTAGLSHAEHYPTPNVYSTGGGYQTIATDSNGKVNYAIDPNLPTFNAAGNNVWTGIRESNRLYNESRWHNTTGDAYTTEVAYSVTVTYRWLRSANFENVTDYLNRANGTCSFNNAQSEHCATRSFAAVDPPWDQLTQPSLAAYSAHEEGHGLGGFVHHIGVDCNTVMSDCVGNLAGPGPDDLTNMRRAHGIYEPPVLLVVTGTTNTARVEANDLLVHDTQWQAHTYKWDTASSAWVFLDAHTANNNGIILWFQENVVANHGAGEFRFAVWSFSSYPNGTSGWNFAGYTNSQVFS